MKRIAFINPNSTEDMTNSCAASLQKSIGCNYTVYAVTNHDGPPAIQGEADGKAAIPGLISTLEANIDFDGFVLGCFDDTGLYEARERSTKPLLGIGQAAFHMAKLQSTHFQVLTTLPISIPVIQNNLKRQGFADSCTTVIASGVPVLELEHNPNKAIDRISKHIHSIEKSQSNPCIILGCAGMTNIYQQLSSIHQSSLIDPIISAARLIRALY